MKYQLVQENLQNSGQNPLDDFFGIFNFKSKNSPSGYSPQEDFNGQIMPNLAFDPNKTNGFLETSNSDNRFSLKINYGSFAVNSSNARVVSSIKDPNDFYYLVHWKDLENINLDVFPSDIKGKILLHHGENVNFNNASIVSDLVDIYTYQEENLQRIDYEEAIFFNSIYSKGDFKNSIDQTDRKNLTYAIYDPSISFTYDLNKNIRLDGSAGVRFIGLINEPDFKTTSYSGDDISDEVNYDFQQISISPNASLGFKFGRSYDKGSSAFYLDSGVIYDPQNKYVGYVGINAEAYNDDGKFHVRIGATTPLRGISSVWIDNSNNNFEVNEDAYSRSLKTSVNRAISSPTARYGWFPLNQTSLIEPAIMVDPVEEKDILDAYRAIPNAMIAVDHIVPSSIGVNVTYAHKDKLELDLGVKSSFLGSMPFVGGAEDFSVENIGNLSVPRTGDVTSLRGVEINLTAKVKL